MHYLNGDQRAIEFQVMLFVATAHINHPFKSYYKRIYGYDQKSRSRWWCLVANWFSSVRRRFKQVECVEHRRAHATALAGEFRQARYGLEQFKMASRRRPRAVRELLHNYKRRARSDEGKRHEFNAFELAPDAAEWHWRGIPKKCLFLKVRDFVSTSWMAYACIRVLLGERLHQAGKWLLGGFTNLPGHCLFPGRVVLHPTIDQFMPLCMGAYHLGWRTWQRFASRRYMMSLLAFLLQSEHDLDKFYKLMEAKRHSIYIASTSQQPTRSPSLSARSFQMQPVLEYTDFDRSLAPPSPPPLLDSSQIDGARMVGVHEHFLRHLMCYEVQKDRRILFKLRPNRTLEARRKLAGWLTRCIIVSMFSYSLLATLFGPAIFLVGLSDFRYAQIYPGCCPKLDHLVAQKQLHFWSFTLTGHRLYALVCDQLENFCLWVDTGVEVAFVVLLTYLMHYDVLLYWKHLHTRLESVLERVRHEQHLVELGTGRASLSEGPRLSGKLSNLGSLVSESEIDELQFEIFDFFRQVEKVDQFISSVITTTIIIWLTSSAWLTYAFLVQYDEEYPLILKLTQSVVFLVLTIGTNELGKLHRCCLKSHRLIWSILAQPRPDPKAQQRFIRVLEFFKERNRTTYTLFHRYPYQGTTYLTVIGWSISWFFVAYSLFRPHRTDERVANLGKHRYFY